jgi:F0F1-type ATP synthase assembly protein I
VAYGLIVLLVIAAIAVVLLLRRNSHAQKTLRDQERDRARREARLPK